MRECSQIIMKSFVFFAVILAISKSSLQVPSDPVHNAVNTLKNCDFSHAANTVKNTCFRNAVEIVAKGLSRGRGTIPSLDTGELGKMTMEELSSNVQLNLLLKNLVVSRLSEFNLLDVRIDYPNRVYEIDILIPELDWNSKYTMNGRILLLPVLGEGNMNALVSHVPGFLTIIIEPKTVNGKRKLVVTNSEVEFEVGKLDAHFSNLDTDGDATLDEAIHHFINNNHNIFINNLYQQLKKGMAEHYKKYFEGVLNEIPTEVMYSE